MDRKDKKAEPEPERKGTVIEYLLLAVLILIACITAFKGLPHAHPEPAVHAAPLGG